MTPPCPLLHLPGGAYLQGDLESGNTFVISGRRPLAIDLQTPVARSAIEPTVLTAPGEPGAITQGHQERRGTQLVLETAPADRAHINVRLRLSR